MKKEVQNCITWMMNKLSEPLTYNWDDKFSMSELKKSKDIFYDELKKHIDFNNITIEEAKELRFKQWDEEEQPDLWLFPLWLVPLIEEGTTVYSIGSNKPKIYNKEEMDNDIRFGCVAYGINIKGNNSDQEATTNN